MQCNFEITGNYSVESETKWQTSETYIYLAFDLTCGSQDCEI
jgi:hypothetical protein